MPVLIERTRPTKQQLRAVHAYIRRQREKGKQALAESKAKEEEEKERKRDEQKKKETVEDVKKEIAELEAKLERLKQKKHDLFSQFKKALNYEDEIRKQQELQAMKAASVHVTSSRSIQGLPVGQGAMTTNVHQQSSLVDSVPSSGVIKRQGSPPHPLSGFIQAQITHSQKIQNFQPPIHVPFPQQSAQVHPAAQERHAGHQHGQGQGSVIAYSQPESRLPGKQHAAPAPAPSGAASESQPPFPRQPPLQQGGPPQQENQQGFAAHQQQFPYHVQQQQSSYQQYAQHDNQKQAFTQGPLPQITQQQGSAQHTQGAQHAFPVQQNQDQAHPQSFHASNVHPMQAQQSYQVHSQQQGYQSKQPAAYQAPQVPMSGQHAYHPQPQQQQPPPPPGQYPVPHGHQGQQDQVHRQQTIVPQQYQQQQGGSQSQGRQGPYEGQQMPPPQQQQQQQHQKHEQRPGTGLGYSQHYTDYQQHHAQGPQSVKRASHKFNPYPYTGSKGHHQGSTGKKYPGKYQGAMEGTSSSGSYTGPSGSSSHSRHHHHQGRSHKSGTGYSSSSQQKPSRYYQ